MTRARDSQRKKFWSAFHSVDRELPHLGDTDAIEDFIANVTKTTWWKNRSSVHDVTVKVRQTHIVGIPSLTSKGWVLPTRVPTTPLEVLMSLCHVLPENTTAWHGPDYCRVLLEATERFLDPTTANALRNAFKTQRVKLRSWSPEAREAAKVRYAKRSLQELRNELAGQR